MHVRKKKRRLKKTMYQRKPFHAPRPSNPSIRRSTRNRPDKPIPNRVAAVCRSNGTQVPKPNAVTSLLPHPTTPLPVEMALKAAVSVTPLPSPPLRRLLSLASSRSAAARRLARVSAAMAATAVHPAVVVGGGRVGQALLSMGPPGADVLVGRGEKVPNDAPGPILVCTRNDDLDAVLEATPKSRWRGTCPQGPQLPPARLLALARSMSCSSLWLSLSAVGAVCICFLFWVAFLASRISNKLS
jgi:hypothetical protein